jgi:DNA-binding NarL/FixJ family response regulator
VTRVLVAARHPVLRAGLEAVLSASPALEAVGLAARASGLADLVSASAAEVVILAADVEDEWFQELLHGGPGASVAVVLLTEDPGGQHAVDALRAGARAVLPADAAPAEIVAAVEAAASGLVVLHPDVLESIAQAVAAPAAAASPGQSLTPREAEVLAMLAEGLGNKEIAWRLKISEHTVKFHVSSIFAKLGASSRTEAVTLGVRRGLIFI